MFFLSKLFDFLFLPPAILILIAATGVILLFRRRIKAAKIVLITGLLLFYLCSIEPAAMLLLPLENAHPPLLGTEDEAAEQADYIVILGGGTISSSPEAGGIDTEKAGDAGPSSFRGTLSPDSLKRLVYGYELHRRYGLPVILSGGLVLKKEGSEPEAVAARRRLLLMGMEESKIFVEEKSRNTWENARYTEERYGPETLILVTSAYHMPRSVYSFSRRGMEVIPAPTDYKLDRTGLSLRSFIPSLSSMENCRTALREYIGNLYYRLK